MRKVDEIRWPTDLIDTDAFQLRVLTALGLAVVVYLLYEVFQETFIHWYEMIGMTMYGFFPLTLFLLYLLIHVINEPERRRDRWVATGLGVIVIAAPLVASLGIVMGVSQLNFDQRVVSIQDFYMGLRQGLSEALYSIAWAIFLFLPAQTLKVVLFAEWISANTDSITRCFDVSTEQNVTTYRNQYDSDCERLEVVKQPSLEKDQCIPVQAPTETTCSSVIVKEESDLAWERVERAFSEFGVSGLTCHHENHHGAISVYEVELPVGMRMAQAVKESNDVSASLGVRSVRLVRGEGKRRVCIEVQNGAACQESIWGGLEEVADLADYLELPVLVGRDTLGKPLLIDLCRAPHLLLAGATNSGKSIALHALIISLIARNHPDNVRLMLIDPKQVEFQAYESVPNLIDEVATETSHVRSLLELAVSEMNERYSQFRELGIVRDRIKYNQLCESMKKPQMPAIVIVIDEYGDLIGQDAEIAELVTALVRKGRAAGLHMVLATQRPTIDVVTGEIKANVPIRVALRTASAHDSRVIIDKSGAEALAGDGDMLLKDQDGVVKRVQGFNVTDEDLSHVKQWYE
ncbi:MAG: DNA translocase FtsK [Candidatus Thiodiazotropha sp. DIVDIV]